METKNRDEDQLLDDFREIVALGGCEDVDLALAMIRNGRDAFRKSRPKQPAKILRLLPKKTV